MLEERGEAVQVVQAVQAVQVVWVVQSAGAVTPLQPQAVLRVRSIQALGSRVVCVQAGPAFSWLARCQPVCLPQADSPHAVLVLALLFVQVQGWRRPGVLRRLSVSAQIPRPIRRARCPLSIASGLIDPAASG